MVPFKARVWRLSSSEFIGLLSEARKYLAVGAEKTAPVTARWVSRSKSGRDDYPDGNVDEIARSMTVPTSHEWVTVSLRSGDRLIDVTIGSYSAQILLRSSDQEWIALTEPWAREQIRKFTPGWAWLTKWPSIIVGPLAGVIIGWAVLYGLQALGMDGGAALIPSLILQISAFLALGSYIVRPRVVLGEPRVTRWRAVGFQLLLLVAGAIMGVMGQRFFDAVFPV